MTNLNLHFNIYKGNQTLCSGLVRTWPNSLFVLLIILNSLIDEFKYCLDWGWHSSKIDKYVCILRIFLLFQVVGERHEFKDAMTARMWKKL